MTVPCGAVDCSETSGCGVGCHCDPRERIVVRHCPQLTNSGIPPLGRRQYVTLTAPGSQIFRYQFWYWTPAKTRLVAPYKPFSRCFLLQGGTESDYYVRLPSCSRSLDDTVSTYYCTCRVFYCAFPTLHSFIVSSLPYVILDSRSKPSFLRQGPVGCYYQYLPPLLYIPFS
jgi:hypothetical protein